MLEVGGELREAIGLGEIVVAPRGNRAACFFEPGAGQLMGSVERGW